MATLRPLTLSSRHGQQQPENHPHCSSRLMKVYRAPGMGLRAALPLEPTEVHGLHTNCSGLWAGGQSTMKTLQLSVQENWPKRCGSCARPCQLIRTPQERKAAGQRGLAKKKYFLGSWLPSQHLSPASLSFRELKANLQGHLRKPILTTSTCCVFSRLHGSSYKAQGDITTGLAQSAKAHVQMPKRCRSGEESQGFCSTWNSDAPKVDNLRTEAYSDTRGPPSGCTGCRDAAASAERREDSLWKLHQEEEGTVSPTTQLPIHS